MNKQTFIGRYIATASPNEDREGESVHITCPNGDCASLECADSEGETVNGTRIPQAIIDQVFNWVDSEGIDY